MYEILILHKLLESQNTMYGLTKSISKTFGFLTNPSFGTIQPALKRLEKNGAIESTKFFTDGGKLYYYYNITAKGKELLIKKLTSKLKKNPVQLCFEIKIRLACSDVLSEEDKQALHKLIMPELLRLKNVSESIQKSEMFSENYIGRVILDNSVCEYKNLVDIAEGILKCRQ